MRDPWYLYDQLIQQIPEDLTVCTYQGGYNWSRVISSEYSIGMAMTIPTATRPAICREETLVGMPLKQAAELVKSWNFVEAAIGMAAINSWYNQPQRAQACGFTHPSVSDTARDAFDVYEEEIRGRNVAVIGHFPFIEKRFAGKCILSILERAPMMGDYPDSACEYILPRQDYVFITGCTFVNKTLPRLLELSRQARVVIVGPSTPLAPVLFSCGIYGLSGFVTDDPEKLENTLRGPSNMDLFQAGCMMDQIRDARSSAAPL